MLYLDSGVQLFQAVGELRPVSGILVSSSGDSVGTTTSRFYGCVSSPNSRAPSSMELSTLGTGSLSQNGPEECAISWLLELHEKPPFFDLGIVFSLFVSVRNANATGHLVSSGNTCTMAAPMP